MGHSDDLSSVGDFMIVRNFETIINHMRHSTTMVFNRPNLGQWVFYKCDGPVDCGLFVTDLDSWHDAVAWRYVYEDEVVDWVKEGF